MGARVKFSVRHQLDRHRDNSSAAQPIRIDIRHDTRGEYFDVTCRRGVDVRILDVRKADRHLLLEARDTGAATSSEPQSKFLCGHDERAWFVAAIPEKGAIRNVQDAKDALKPRRCGKRSKQHGVPARRRDRRRTAAFVRQGEWFFIPRPEARINQKLVLRNEPIRRGRGKPHVCQFMFRSGGEQVHVNNRYPNGLTTTEYQALPPQEQASGNWKV